MTQCRLLRLTSRVLLVAALSVTVAVQHTDAFGVVVATPNASACSSAPCTNGGVCTTAKATKAPSTSSGSGSGPCTDLLHFKDAWGTCSTYEAQNWCTARGQTGRDWQAGWGQLSSAATGSCCACGGGYRLAAAASARRHAQQSARFACRCKQGYSGSTCATHRRGHSPTRSPTRSPKGSPKGSPTLPGAVLALGIVQAKHTV